MKKIVNNKIFRMITTVVKVLFVLMIVAYLGFILVQKTTNNSSIKGYRVFTILTESMKGVYNVNDVILVKEVDTNKLKVDDDIAYIGKEDSYSGKIVTHRITKIEEKNSGRIFHTKGVNNVLEDPVISDSQVYGKVIRKLFIISIINHIVHSKVGFFFLIFVPLVLVIFLEIADTIIDAKLEKEEIKKINK